MTPRERTERREYEMLSPKAAKAAESEGRVRPEPECEVRTCFMRDADRIIHSKAFRRLMFKTQVFLCPEGDHYRTRLTHATEVSRIARTMAAGLRLNENLTEAIALGHDLGHAPFGHAGERALNKLLEGGFTHNAQSLRVVDCLERGGAGLNLCAETRDGILCHTGEVLPATLEGELVRLADRVAYINHDMDDSIRAGILAETDLPKHITGVLGSPYTKRIDTMTRDVIHNSEGKAHIMMSPEAASATDGLRSFMYERVYHNPVAKSEESKVFGVIARLLEHFTKNPDDLPEENRYLIERDGVMRAAADYIAGMTDRFCREKAQQLFLPKGWEKR